MICTCDHDYGDVCSVCAPEDPVIKAHIESGGLARDVAMMQQWAAEMAAQSSIFPFYTRHQTHAAQDICCSNTRIYGIVL